MQVPSMRVANRLPISWASCGGKGLAQEADHLLGLDGENGLPGELLVERPQGGRRAEHQVGGVFDLHQAQW
jgi:hypothetical protein